MQQLMQRRRHCPSRAASAAYHRASPQAVVAAAARRRANARASAAAATEAAAPTSSSSSSNENDPTVTQRLELRDSLTGCPIHVFGVDHRFSQPDIAEWVLRARPSAVVAETACTPQHGVAAATPLDTSPEQLGAPGGSAFFLRMFAQVAATLKQQLLDVGMKNMSEKGMGAARAYEESVSAALSEKDGLWAQASANFNGEQLAYVAGLAVGAPVLFGDRPKGLTYRRLWHSLSPEDLDAAFEDERVREAGEELRVMAEAWRRNGKGELPPSVAEALAAVERGIAPVKADGAFAGVKSAEGINAAERIMYLEREAVMCAVLAVACAQAKERREAARRARHEAAAEANGGSTAPLQDEDDDDNSSPIAAVFGAAHLPGLQRLWQSGEWRALLAAGGDVDADAANSDPAALLASSPLLTAPTVDPSSILSPQAGTKRGLLEALLSNSVTEEVLADLDNHLPPIPPLQTEGAASAEEVLEASLTAAHPATASRAWSREIYGTFRMRLAALPIEVLDGLVSAWPGGGGNPFGSELLPPEARSAWGLLAPLRALRPTYGGPGWDAAVGLQLRQLDYELGPPGGDGAAEEDDDAASEASAATAVDQGMFFQDV